MPTDRIESLPALLLRNPNDGRLQFGLALELEKQQRWQEVADILAAYLAHTDDEGNAWGRLGRAFRELGRDDPARDAYAKGIEAANRHGHPSMAADYEEILADWE